MCRDRSGAVAPVPAVERRKEEGSHAASRFRCSRGRNGPVPGARAAGRPGGRLRSEGDERRARLLPRLAVQDRHRPGQCQPLQQGAERQGRLRHGDRRLSVDHGAEPDVRRRAGRALRQPVPGLPVFRRHLDHAGRGPAERGRGQGRHLPQSRRRLDLQGQAAGPLLFRQHARRHARQPEEIRRGRFLRQGFPQGLGRALRAGLRA